MGLRRFVSTWNLTPSPSTTESMRAESGSAAFDLANGAMALLFTFAAAVQYNDPDPLRWMAIYLAAAAACVLAILHRLPRWVPIAVGLAALVWVATLVPHVLGRVGWSEMFDAWEMKDARVEEGRETYGLLIVVVWMTVLALAGRRRAAPGIG
jgi:hypothetical protein